MAHEGLHGIHPRAVTVFDAARACGWPQRPLWDDGDPFVPGDDAFSTAKAQVAASGGAADGFNYAGQSASAPE